MRRYLASKMRNAGKANGTRSWRRHLWHGALAMLALLLVSIGVASVLAMQYWMRLEKTAPGADEMRAVRIATPSVLLTASGERLATFSRGHAKYVPLEQISSHVIDALLATEDRRFFEHKGVDAARTLGAAWYTLRGSPQGGSTLTQQLVRNVFPEAIGRARTMERKVREIQSALKIEKEFSKQEILEIYLNSVPFLYRVTGIEMAARTYFDKSALALDPAESATLVGMLKGTSFYNPVLQPERALARRNLVLAQMLRSGTLSQEQYEYSVAQELGVALHLQPDPLGTQAPHFAAHVGRELSRWAKAYGYNIHTDGLIVTSTLDDRLQEAASAAVARQAQVLQQIADVEWAQRDARVASRSPQAYAKLREKIEPFSAFWEQRPGLLETFARESPTYRRMVSRGASEEAALKQLMQDPAFLERLRTHKTRLEAGFVAIDPRSGEVKAWVGSRDYPLDQFDHVAQATRQPGSTFKPLVYGAALELGLDPEQLYPDGQVEIALDGGGIWRPTDMSGFSGRMMTLREGLVFSKNTVTAQVMQDVGLQSVVRLAQAAGVRKSRLVPVPSLSLGTSPVTLLEMVSSYGTIAQMGTYHAPRTIKRITDRHGTVLAEFSPAPEEVMSRDTAIELVEMMRGVVSHGTGTDVRTRFNLVADIAGKTGTSQYNADGWFILMHPQLVAGAWVGFNDQRVTMRSNYWGQGGHNAVLLVGDFFRTGIKEKRIDAGERFPRSKRPPPLMVRAPIQDIPRAVQGIDLMVEDGHGVVASQDDGRVVVVSPADNEIIERRALLEGGAIPVSSGSSAPSTGTGASASDWPTPVNAGQ